MSTYYNHLIFRFPVAVNLHCFFFLLILTATLVLWFSIIFFVHFLCFYGSCFSSGFLFCVKCFIHTIVLFLPIASSFICTCLVLFLLPFYEFCFHKLSLVMFCICYQNVVVTVIALFPPLNFVL